MSREVAAETPADKRVTSRAAATALKHRRVDRCDTTSTSLQTDTEIRRRASCVGVNRARIPPDRLMSELELNEKRVENN